MDDLDSALAGAKAHEEELRSKLEVVRATQRRALLHANSQREVVERELEEVCGEISKIDLSIRMLQSGRRPEMTPGLRRRRRVQLAIRLAFTSIGVAGVMAAFEVNQHVLPLVVMAEIGACWALAGLAERAELFNG